MTYDEQTGDYTLSSGRRFSSQTSVIGLSLPRTDDAPEWVWPQGRLTVGGEFVLRRDEPNWTPEERAELADEMIRRWTAFKEAPVP